MPKHPMALLRFSSGALGLAFAITLIGCAPRTPLHDLPLAEQRAAGEAAIVQACAFPLDVESTITRKHRETWAVAHEYIDIASNSVSPGGLSQFFSAETLAACGARDATEAGGVRAAIGYLIHLYGTEAEVLARVERVVSPEAYCAHVVPSYDARYESACEALGFPTVSARD